MASYHLSMKTVKRSAGRSATAAAAYRHAERIECQREGRVHDYRAKSGVEHSFIVVGEGAPEWAQDRQALWNAAEAREGRKDSVVAREWELALPSELDAIGRRVLARTFARELVDRYGVAADVAVHAPHREGDQRNWHAHVLTTTRRLEAQGLTDKTLALDAKATGGAEITHMRGRWAELQNHALERQGHEQRVDHRTLAMQRENARALGHEAQADTLDRAPEIKLGPVVSAIERREQRQAEREERTYEPLTERGAQVHEARQARSLLAELARELAQVRERLGQELRERAELARQTYAHAREEGANPISASLAALRAAAQRQGIEHEDGRGREEARDHIREQLASLRERAYEQARETGADSIRTELARLRERSAGHDRAEVTREAETARQPGPEHGLQDTRDRLGRILEQQEKRTHEAIREQLTEALEQARPTRDQEHEREELAHRQRQRQRGHDHGWGL